MKREHDLFRHCDAPSFLAGLRARHIDFDELMSRFVDKASPYSALLVGSLAEQTGSAASDVDILLLVSEAASVLVHSDYLRLNDGKSFEIHTYEQGVEFNIK